MIKTVENQKNSLNNTLGKVNKSTKEKLKSFLLILSSLIFSIGLILFSTFEVQQTQAQSQIDIDSENILESSQAADATPSNDLNSQDQLINQQIEEYYLPYPGILPDHPLYWLKMLRDRVLLIITRDPLAKLERNLLYADKRLGAAKALIEGGKVQLGVTTATKGEKYLEQAILIMEDLEKQNKISAELKQRIYLSSLKHHQILVDVSKKLTGDAKDTLVKAAEKTLDNSNKIEN